MMWLDGTPDGVIAIVEDTFVAPRPFTGQAASRAADDVATLAFDKLLNQSDKYRIPHAVCAFGDGPATNRASSAMILGSGNDPITIFQAVGVVCGGPGSRCFTKMKAAAKVRVDMAANMMKLGSKPQRATSCLFCSKTSMDPKKELKRCSRCKRGTYCSPECQRVDFPRHKKECTPAEDLKAEEKEVKEAMTNAGYTTR